MKDSKTLWAIVLAGGEGARLRPVMTEIYGIDILKQYCACTGQLPSLELGRRVPKDTY